MRAKGCGPDNTAAEGFFGRPRNGFFYGRDWKGMGHDEFHRRLTVYPTHYNETGVKKLLGLDEPRAIPKKPWTGRLTVQKNIRTPTDIVPAYMNEYVYQ